MKITWILLAALSLATAAVIPENGYLPPSQVLGDVGVTEVPIEKTAVLGEDGYEYKTIRRLKYRNRRDVSEIVAPEYLPPVEEQIVEAGEPTEAPEESAVLADDGYQYKTVRRLKYRKRRDVSEVVAPEYLPPTEEEVVEAADPTEAPEESAVLADDGYQYKTVRRLKYRKRRDVSELVAPEYLPPTEEEVVEADEPTKAPEESAVLADDGYQYKTVRRLKYRKRRDVSEVVAPEYLPPTEEEVVEAADPTEAPEESAVLADDGYQYKTVRRLKYRKRRDVSDVLGPEFLPPTEEEVVEAADPTEAPEESAVLAEDGYQYKTVRRLKYRKRRDVSEVVAPEYLPPTEEEVVEAAEPTEAPEESAVLADDGYRYKTVRKLKYRKRRDMSELVAPEYLPPTEEVVEAADPTEAPEESAVLADDGYQYKTVRRLKYRKRRDVSEVLAPEYLPPTEEEVVEAADPTEAPEESAVLADDGYQYKTVRRLKYRKRRDVSEVVAPEYLPPTEEEAADPTEAPEESAALADDGYQYKTVRRLKYRKRRDVSEVVAPENLPPTEEEVVEAADPTEAPEESAVLADDGYQYKTVRRLKYRKRRDVSEVVAPEYLPPTEEEVVEAADPTEAPEESAVLADDGYQYKTVRRLKYRKRRDVSDVVAPEYLPPTEEEFVEAADPTEAPEESAVLADDGYQYKTVRRLKYRKRRDVSEVVSPEYLPPTEEEVVEAADPTEAPEESAVLADDGYQYKTVRRLKYRKRRDVSEVVSPEYLPPTEEEVVEAAETTETTEAPEESAVLADDGYRYKTVRKLKYRKRRDVSEVVAPEYLPPTEEVVEAAELTQAPEESAVLANDGYRYKTVKRFRYRY